MPFELFVAVRYLLARRKQAFISLISFISTLGVGVGVMAVIIALALMTGLQEELRDRILGASAHVYVWKLGDGGIRDYKTEVAALEAVPGVEGAAPVILGKALITTDRGESFITVKGIDPSLEGNVTDLNRAMRSGSLDSLSSLNGEDGLDGIVIGEALALQLGAFVGDTVTLLTPKGTLSPMGILPRTRRLEIVGVYSLGLQEFDAGTGFVSLDVAGRLNDRDRPDFIELRVDDIYRAPQIADAVTEKLGSHYRADDWTDLNQSLFSALWVEKMAISLTIGLIVMVAALNIVASLVLLVMDKSRDIAILKTMGASPRSIMRIFMLQGLIIGLVGTTVGAIGGVVVSHVFDRYRLIRIPMDVYQISYVPFTIELQDFVFVITAAVLICFVATLYPSRQAARLDPAVALRYQ